VSSGQIGKESDSLSQVRKSFLSSSKIEQELPELEVDSTGLRDTDLERLRK
jgi:hypothetical protein